MKKSIFSIFILILAACVSSQVTVSPESTARRPTFTPRPTHTPIPRATLNPTLISANQTQAVHNTATASVIQTAFAQFPHVCKNGYYYPGWVSPDGLWLQEECYSEEDKDVILTLSNRETKVSWKLVVSDYASRREGEPLSGGITVIHWSDDGKYVYFNSHSGGDGGECFVNGFDSGLGLFRFDLQTGNITTIISAKGDLRWYGFSLSPKDKWLLYGAHSRNLQILDITTGQSISVAHDMDFSQSGGYVWSSDALKFVYSTVTYTADYMEIEGFSLRLVDAQTGSERILLQSKTSCYLAREWRENGVLLIEYDDENYNRTLMEYDLNSNTIIDIPATPNP